MSAAETTNGAAKARTNGAQGDHQGDTATTVDAFPVESYRDAARHLRRPFTEHAVKFKVQATWPKDSPSGALVVAYIDARLVIERLNLVCPHLWDEPQYEATQRGLMWCRLRVDGITRCDVGEGEGKGLVSDALKRAAVHFGIGVSLYAVPKMRLDKQRDAGCLKDKQTRNGPTLELTDTGERKCRELYATWLNAQGKAAFGEPLDHGDSPDSVGDPDLPPEPDASEAPRRNGNARRGGQQQERQPEQPPPADQLAALLAQEDDLQPLRQEADKGMQALGAKPAQRLRELTGATSKRALDALVTRINNAVDQTAGE